MPLPVLIFTFCQRMIHPRPFSPESFQVKFAGLTMNYFSAEKIEAPLMVLRISQLRFRTVMLVRFDSADGALKRLKPLGKLSRSELFFECSSSCS
jgi:hypothetical protein